MAQELLTIAKTLDAVNQRFYEHHSRGFHQTRQAPWPAWSTLFPNQPISQSINVLDVGCGNGRFAAFLAQSEYLAPKIRRYDGLDRSPRLLQLAKELSLPFIAHWRLWNWFEASTVKLPPSDEIVAFGVLHHIFAYECRLHFLLRLASALTPGGRLTVSAWNFGAHGKYRTKYLDTNEVCEHIGILPSDLEKNDYFLGFGNGEGLPRYCHWADHDEMEALSQDLQARLPNVRFEPYANEPSDMNQYWCWRAIVSGSEELDA